MTASTRPFLPNYVRRAPAVGTRPSTARSRTDDASPRLVDAQRADGLLSGATPMDIVRVDRFGRVPLHALLDLMMHEVSPAFSIEHVRHGVVAVRHSTSGTEYRVDKRGRLQLPLGVRHRSRLSPGDRLLIASTGHDLILVRLDLVNVSLTETVVALA